LQNTGQQKITEEDVKGLTWISDDCFAEQEFMVAIKAFDAEML